MAQLGVCTCGWRGRRWPHWYGAWIEVLVHVMREHPNG